MTDGDGNSSNIIINLQSGTLISTTQVDSYLRVVGNIWQVDSGWYRAQLTTLVTSKDQISINISVLNSNSNTSFVTVDTSYIEIYGAQLRKFPFMGQYVQVSSQTVVGTGWQTGSQLCIAGLNSSEVMFNAGTRFEIINQYYDLDDNVFERSEFKRLTTDLRANHEGWACAEFEPPIRNAPITGRSNDAPQVQHLGETLHNAVVFDRPEMKARLLAGTIRYTEKPLRMMDVTFDVIEDMT
jgi:hypothetical protein